LFLRCRDLQIDGWKKVHIVRMKFHSVVLQMNKSFHTRANKHHKKNKILLCEVFWYIRLPYWYIVTAVSSSKISGSPSILTPSCWTEWPQSWRNTCPSEMLVSIYYSTQLNFPGAWNFNKTSVRTSDTGNLSELTSVSKSLSKKIILLIVSARTHLLWLTILSKVNRNQ
jgi:hypothetical protein